MSKTYQINTSAKINGALTAEKAENEWRFTNADGAAIVIQPEKNVPENRILFQILDTGGTDSRFSVDYKGTIRAHSMIVESLVTETENETVGDLTVNGGVNIKNSGVIGTDSASHSLSVYGDFHVWKGERDEDESSPRESIFYVDARSTVGKAELTGNLIVSGNISEGGVQLATKYAAIGHNHDSVYLKITDASNTYVKRDGSTAITNTQSITKGSNTITIGGSSRADTINCTTELNINSNGQAVKIGGATSMPSGNVTGDLVVGGKVTASNIKAHSLTIPAGEVSSTWTHNYGSTGYVITFMTNSASRHVYFSNKTADAVTINIDDEYDEPIIVDLILIGS